MKNVFCFCNQKGGVGKTTSIINLAASLALMGGRTLIIDVDPQANATSGLGLSVDNLRMGVYQLIAGTNRAADSISESGIANLELIPSTHELVGAEVELASTIGREFVLKEACRDILDQYEFVLVDCPPSLGLLTLNALVMSDFLMIPLQCEYYALEGLSQLMKTYELVKTRLNRDLEIGGILLTMADFRTNLTQQVIDDVRKHFGESVFNTVIPRSVRISEAPSFGKPAIIYDPSSKGSRAYMEAAREFVDRFMVEKESTELSTRR